MPKIDYLTQDQFVELLDGYFAKPEKRYKMTLEEIKDLAQRLNGKVDVPIINETKEEKILIEIGMKVDTFLYDNLPNEFYDLVRSVEDGIDEDEAKRLIKRLAKLANEKIYIPYLPEKMEYIAIRFIIATIINAARKNWDLAKAKSAIDAVAIPDKVDASDSQFESLVVA